MPATKLDIVVEQGRTLRVAAEVLEEDGITPDTGLAGWTGAMQLRAAPSSSTVLAAATVTIDTATGVVTAEVDDATTADFAWRSAYYDLIITDGTDTEALLYGIARVRPSVTR